MTMDERERLIKEWKSKQKGNLINDIKRTIENRRSLTCNHCERQYDDDMCDGCLAVYIVNKFQKSIEILSLAGLNAGEREK